MKWETVIGLEVHARLSTCSKLFSGSASAYGAPPNSQVSYIDAGLPGVLPVPNRDAVYKAVLFGLAVDAGIETCSWFERKNYFYPDLPKGYQISQFQKPIVKEGSLLIEPSPGQFKKIIISRAHLEEDAGKSIHDADPLFTGIDLNRAGVPLLEIVTAPCISSAEEAVLYLKALHRLLCFLKICDGNMQEGSFRCDVNLSLRPVGSALLGTRTELKNLNSFRFIEKAILYETARHEDLLNSNQSVVQETRLYNAEKNRTEAMRSKEDVQDYRYFPDPDLLPIQLSANTIETIRKTLPPLPQQIEAELKHTGWSQEDIRFVLSSPAVWEFFSRVRILADVPDKLIVNWLKGPCASSPASVSADKLADLLILLHQKRFSHNKARELFKLMTEHPEQSFAWILQQSGPERADTALLETMVKSVLERHPEQVSQFRQGKDKLLGFFVGLIMKETQGQADPEEVKQAFKKILTDMEN